MDGSSVAQAMSMSDMGSARNAGSIGLKRSAIGERQTIARAGTKVKGPEQPAPHSRQIWLEDSREVPSTTTPPMSSARLAKIDPAERGAVAEPEGEPVAGLAGLVRVRAPHGATGDQVDERTLTSRRP